LSWSPDVEPSRTEDAVHDADAGVTRAGDAERGLPGIDGCQVRVGQSIGPGEVGQCVDLEVDETLGFGEAQCRAAVSEGGVVFPRVVVDLAGSEMCAGLKLDGLEL
jgi:hypothetical protein